MPSDVQESMRWSGSRVPLGTKVKCVALVWEGRAPQPRSHESLGGGQNASSVVAPADGITKY